MGLGDDTSGFATDRLQVWEFYVDWSTPSNSTFGDATNNPNFIIDTASTPPLLPFVGSDAVAHRNDPCTAGVPCIPQKNTTRTVDALADRLMHQLQFRDLGAYQAMVVNHTIDGTAPGALASGGMNCVPAARAGQSTSKAPTLPPML